MFDIKYKIEMFESQSQRLPVGFKVTWSDPYNPFNSYTRYIKDKAEIERLIDEIQKFFHQTGGKRGFDWSVQKSNHYLLVQVKDAKVGVLFKMKFG